MTNQPKILCLPGSARKESVNKKLAYVASEMLNERGVRATYIDPANFPMPIYNGDFEAENGLPENAKVLKDMIVRCDGMLIVSPEYNSSIPPLLKNMLDWASRKEQSTEPVLAAYRNKIVGLISASPGGHGGARALVPLRMMLENIGVHVISQQFSLSNAMNAFSAHGRLENELDVKGLEAVISELVHTTNTFSA